MCRLSSCRKSCCCFFFRCRVSSSAGKPSGLAHRSLRSIARRLACALLICVALQGDDLSLSLVCLGGGIHAQKLERQRRTEKKPKTKQMQEAGRGESRRDSRGLLRFNSLLLSGFIRNEAAIKLRRRKGEKNEVPR